jgi:hypothetical protein
MLPAPRIIAIDDEPQHLQGLADGLNRYGVACLQVHFTGDDSQLKPCPYVRVIFADLHLSPGGAGQDHARHFTVIGGLLEQRIAPNGPYIIVLWTRFADQAAGLKTFLDQRLQGPKPFAVVSLDKNQHLDAQGRVIDPQRLVAAIDAIVRQEPHIAALLNWEERILGAAADTVSALLEIGLTTTGTETAPQRLRRLVYHLAAAGVGEKHVFDDRFGAVNEALLPILADRVSALKSRAGQDDIWTEALLETDVTSPLTAIEAATLNRLSHIASGAEINGAARGAVILLPPSMSGENFAASFGMSPVDAAKSQFGCTDFAEGDGRFRWTLVQVQATCDYAQRQPGPLPFVLALEMPEASVQKGSLPSAIWASPKLAFEGDIRVLHANSRFQVNLADAAASGIAASYRMREELLIALVYYLHGYGARPGNISFHEKKVKAGPAPVIQAVGAVVVAKKAKVQTNKARKSGGKPSKALTDK